MPPATEYPGSRDRGIPAGRRARGMVLPIALAIMAVLAVVTMAVYTLRQQTYRGLSFLDGYLDAVAVGEACFVEVVERLGATKWSERWFKAGASSGEGSYMDGTYDYMIADAPRLGEVDLVVWARNADSEVTMHWRLLVDPYTLSPYREIRTIYFGYGSKGMAAGGGLAELQALVGPALEERETNRPWAEDLQARVLGSDPGQIPGVLGIPENGMILDEIPSPTKGGTPRPVPPVTIGRSGAELGTPGGNPGGPGPAPTPTPAPGSPATPTTSVALADSVAQLQDLSSQYDQALDFLRGALAKLDKLEGPLDMAAGLGIPGASTCRKGYDRVVSRTRSTLSSVEQSQQQLESQSSRSVAAMGPPAPTQEQAQAQSQEAQDLIARTPDPCDSVNQLVQDAESILQDCAGMTGSFGDLIGELREEVQSLRGKNGNCSP